MVIVKVSDGTQETFNKSQASDLFEYLENLFRYGIKFVLDQR